MSRVYRNRALLESAAGRPFQTALGTEIHKGLFAKGAALFHSLITNHPFGDGNKRTAVLSLELFLIANGQLLLTSQSDMYNLAISTASAGERQASQDDVLNVIANAIRQDSATLRQIGSVKAYRNLYIQVSEARKGVRNHPLNATGNPYNPRSGSRS